MAEVEKKQIKIKFDSFILPLLNTILSETGSSILSETTKDESITWVLTVVATNFSTLINYLKVFKRSSLELIVDEQDIDKLQIRPVTLDEIEKQCRELFNKIDISNRMRQALATDVLSEDVVRIMLEAQTAGSLFEELKAYYHDSVEFEAYRYKFERIRNFGDNTLVNLKRMLKNILLLNS